MNTLSKIKQHYENYENNNSDNINKENEIKISKNAEYSYYYARNILKLT